MNRIVSFVERKCVHCVTKGLSTLPLTQGTLNRMQLGVWLVELRRGDPCEVISHHHTRTHRQTDEAKMLLLWVKLLDLTTRQLQFGANPTEVISQLNSLSSLLVRCGEDKASEGLLGVFGLGKKSPYSHR